ncbi:hypothetical protein XAR_1630 [Xanthomonas citri pv. glycines str. 8ra]|nr:hypothetical protein XAR_1630 [Xanthomonas citri pv. glycines str. 8ra]
MFAPTKSAGRGAAGRARHLSCTTREDCQNCAAVAQVPLVIECARTAPGSPCPSSNVPRTTAECGSFRGGSSRPSAVQRAPAGHALHRSCVVCKVGFR